MKIYKYTDIKEQPLDEIDYFTVIDNSSTMPFISVYLISNSSLKNYRYRRKNKLGCVYKIIELRGTFNINRITSYDGSGEGVSHTWIGAIDKKIGILFKNLHYTEKIDIDNLVKYLNVDVDD